MTTDQPKGVRPASGERGKPRTHAEVKQEFKTHAAVKRAGTNPSTAKGGSLMPATTPKYALRKPIDTDPASVPDTFDNFTADLEAILASFMQGTLAARPAPDKAGRWYRASDAGLYYDTGSAWIEVVREGDARLSNQRTPTDLSVTNAKVAAAAAIARSKLDFGAGLVNADMAAAAAIAESKLALASDAAAGTPSRRSLGTGATQAAPGNDARLSDQRVPTDGSVTAVKVGVLPRAKVAQGTAQALASGVVTLLTMEVGDVVYDVGHGGVAHFVDADDGLRCRVAGCYTITGWVDMAAASAGVTTLQVRQNNVIPDGAIGSIANNNVAGVNVFVSVDLVLAVNDLIQLFGYQDSGANLNVQKSALSMRFVSA